MKTWLLVLLWFAALPLAANNYPGNCSPPYGYVNGPPLTDKEKDLQRRADDEYAQILKWWPLADWKVQQYKSKWADQAAQFRKWNIRPPIHRLPNDPNFY